MEQLINQLMMQNSMDPNISKILNQAKQLLKELQQDIINRKITPETIKRQQQLKVKLLEAENALKQQGYENKRKAETANDIYKNPPKELILKYKKESNQKDILKLNSLKLNSFYKTKYFDYIKSLR